MQYHQPLATLTPPQRVPNHQQHVVPFGQLPTAQPGALGFGFGLSAHSSLGIKSWTTSPGGNGGGTWKTPAQGSSGTNGGSSPLKTPTANGRRRRRSETPPDEEEISRMDTGIREARGLKRFKVLEDPKIPAKDTVKEIADLGKALASLSKESLLTLVTSLITTQPSLVPTIQSLLPPPTLSATLASLAALERSVLTSLPAGSSLREDYVYGRIRVPLEEYITESKGFLNAFCSPAPGTTTPSSGAENEIGHPSTTFAFLHALTSSLRRLEVALPSSPLSLAPGTPGRNPLSIHLLPLLINSWHVFLTKLSTSVNQEGKILSGSTLRTWFERIEEVCVESPGVATGGRREGPARKALEGVRDRMRKEVGWLVGLRELPGTEQGMMVEEEEL